MTAREEEENRMSHRLTIALIVATATFGTRVGAQDSLSLIANAKQLSDIRSQDAPAFELKASYNITLENGTTVEGTYAETWFSSRLWRSETKTGDSSRTKLAKDKTLWLQSNSSNPRVNNPNDHLGSLEYLLGLHFEEYLLQSELWKGAKIRTRNGGLWSVRCIKSKGAFKPELCFDSASGELVARSGWERLAGGNMTEYSCAYTQYRKFGAKVFPRSIQCVEGGKPILQGTVVELNTASAPSDSSGFAPLAGAQQMAYCPGEKRPPQILQQKDPNITSDSFKRGGVETFSVTVGVDGIPRELTIIRSVGKKFDKSAGEALREWRFRPASCDGEPMEAEIEVEFETHY